MNTYLAGTSVLAQLLALRDQGDLVTAIIAPDTLSCTIYNQSGQSIVAGSAADGGVVGDGAGNYRCVLTLPSAVGNYYLRWESRIGSDIGKQDLPFAIRLRAA